MKIPIIGSDSRCVVILFLVLLLTAGASTGKAQGDPSFWLNQGDSLFKLPLYDRASEAFSKAHQVAISNNDRAHELEAVVRLAMLDNIATRTKVAMNRLKSHSKMVEDLASKRPDLHALYREELGRAYEDRGDIEKAGEHYRKAMQLKLQVYGEEDARTAYAVMLMGRYHNYKGEYDSAFYCSTRAYRICERNPEHIDKIRYIDLLLQHAFDFKNSRDIYIDDKLNITKTESSGEWKKAKTKLINGFVYWVYEDGGQEHYLRTRDYYREAVRLAQNTFRFPSVDLSRCYQGLGSTFTDRIWYEFPKSVVRGEIAFDSAKANYERALAINRQIFGNHHKMIAVSYWTLGLIHLYCPDTSLVFKSLYIANKGLNALIPSFEPETPFQLPVIGNHEHLAMINNLVTVKANALSILYKTTHRRYYLDRLHDLNKYRLNLWAACIRHLESDATGATIGYFNNHPFEHTIFSSMELFKITSDSSHFEEIFDAMERRKMNDITEQKIRIRQNSSVSNKKPNPLNIYPATLKSVRKSLIDKTTAFISLSFQYTNPDSSYQIFAIAVSNNGVTTTVSTYPYYVAESMLKKIRSSMIEGDARVFAESSYALYQIVLEPVLKTLSPGIKNLVISVSNSRHDIPYDVLITEPVSDKNTDFRKLPYLINRYSLQYAISGGHLLYSQSQDLPKGVSVHAFMPEMIQRSKLPFNERVLRKLEKKYAGSFYFGKNAGIPQFREKAGVNGILHLVSHSEADMNTVNASSILFSGDHHEDTLSIADLYSIPVRSPLTILSACETARGKEVYAEGSRSFARVFSSVGSLSTLSTLWRVDDKATATLLDYFYEGLEQGMSKPRALQYARLKYIKLCRTSEAASPFYWAGIVFSGDPRPLVLEERRPWKQMLLYGAIGLVVISLFCFLHKKQGSSVRKSA